MKFSAEKSERRTNIITSVRTLLGFFTLVILILEGILAVLASRAEGSDFTILLTSMAGLMFVLLLAVVFIAIKRPKSLVDAIPSNENL